MITAVGNLLFFGTTFLESWTPTHVGESNGWTPSADGAERGRSDLHPAVASHGMRSCVKKWVIISPSSIILCQMSGNYFRRLPRFKVINANQPCHVYTAQMSWSWESSSVRIGVSQNNPCPRSSRSPFRIVYAVNVVQYAMQFECMESCILYIQCAERND